MKARTISSPILQFSVDIHNLFFQEFGDSRVNLSPNSGPEFSLFEHDLGYFGHQSCVLVLLLGQDNHAFPKEQVGSTVFLLVQVRLVTGN